MGALTLPPGGLVYVDANCVIYAVERIAPHCDTLAPVWHAAARGEIAIASSELTLLEVLVRPVQRGDRELERSFREFLRDSAEFTLLPIDRVVLEEAVRIRASAGMKTPDAIHAATAMAHGAQMFVTNDAAFRRIASLNATVVSEIG